MAGIEMNDEEKAAADAFNLISENRLRYLSGLKGLNLIYLEKD